MLGDFTPSKTVVFNFNTHKADGTPITLAGTPALSVYKNSTTESTSGITLTVDYDSRTGMHHVVIDTSSDGTFYAAANDFDVVITTGTVDSISVVGTRVGSFSLSNRSALRPATADRTLVVDASGLADANTVKVGPTGSGTAQTARDLGTSVIVASGTVTTVTNQLTAAQIATGVWQDVTSGDFTVSSSIGKSLYTTGNAPGAASGIALVGSNMGTISGALTAAQIATGVWQDATAGDFTTALSVGKSVMNGVALGTGLTINGYTGNTPQTGDAFARLGAAGAGLTALGDTRIANLDATISSRTKPADTQAAVTVVNGLAAGTITAASIAANAITAAKVATDAIGAAQLAADAVAEIQSGLATPTNITAGTITTVTNLTNAPTVGDLTATMKTSVTTAATAATPTVTAGTVSDKTGYGLSATGLDSIPITPPTTVAATFREMVVMTYRRFFRKSTLTATQLKTFANDGTTAITTQTVADDGTTQTAGDSA